MRRSILFLGIILSLTAVKLYAQYEAVNVPEVAEESTIIPPVEATTERSLISGNDLSNLDLVAIKARLNENRIGELERRITSLERAKRFQDEKLRALDRTVDDLKKRR